MQSIRASYCARTSRSCSSQRLSRFFCPGLCVRAVWVGAFDSAGAASKGSFYQDAAAVGAGAGQGLVPGDEVTIGVALAAVEGLSAAACFLEHLALAAGRAGYAGLGS